MAEGAREYSAETRGIRVRVASFYLEDQSVPESRRYMWAYRIVIENRGNRTVQLLRRTWEITDATGRTFRVEGDGVVGEQPVLEPGEAFEYTSGTPLETPSGFMVGWYHMVAHGEGPAVALAAVAAEPFDVAIPAFSLDSPDAGGRVH